MTIRIAYRHSRLTALPQGLSPPDIWAVARELRAHLADEPAQRTLAVHDLLDRLEEVEINGIPFEVDFDLDHEVHRAGKSTMGVTEFDKASPTCIMVSINGPKLRETETLLKSTVAHEIGHVMFEAPNWILTQPDKPVRSGFTGANASRDPREVRANEFMGALLVQGSLVRVDLQRLAKKHRFGASPRPSTIMSGAPAYDAAYLDDDSVQEVIFTLAERYDVSPSFMRVRLERYDLLRTGRFIL